MTTGEGMSDISVCTELLGYSWEMAGVLSSILIWIFPIRLPAQPDREGKNQPKIAVRLVWK